MPKYLYKAKSLAGQEKSGVLEAKDVRQLSQKLHGQGFMLIKADEIGETKKKAFEISLPFFKVSLTDKMFFIRNLQVMIAAGLPLPRAIGALSNQVKDTKMRTALLDIKEEITKGKSLSESMARHSEIFSELFQSMIKVGEESGTLEKVLGSLGLQLEKEHALKSKITGAMVYPAVIICAMIGVGVLMLVMVIPKLAATFEELNIELPVTTQFIIGLADFVIQSWYLAAIGIVVLIILFSQLIKITEVRKIIDKVVLKIPIFSPIIKTTNSASTVRTLSSLISAGTPLPRALEITSGTMSNYYYKTAMKESATKVRKGVKLSEVLSTHKGIYPPIVIQMIAVGEETGETSTILSKLADFFEEEAGNATKNLAAVIEPLLMVVIGVVIGFFAVSMIQPMYSMLGAI